MGNVLIGAQIAVTGATGFIGRHVLQKLTTAGYRPVAMIRPSSAAGLFGSSADIREADITDRRAVALAFSGMDAAIHLAGMISTRATDAIDLTRVNVLGANNVLSGARKANLQRLLFMSTTSAVGALLEDEPGRASMRLQTSIWRLPSFHMLPQSGRTLSGACGKSFTEFTCFHRIILLPYLGS